MHKKIKNSTKKETNFKAVSRRKFIRNTSLALGAVTIIPRHVLGNGFVAPSDKINLGIIGLGKQGNILSSKFKNNTNAQIIAGSDVWDTKREFFKNNIEKLYAEQRSLTTFKGITTHVHYQDILENKAIDGVIIATPDHWHALQAIDAMNAGKDVYCEKPMTNTIKEGRAMVKAVNKNNTIFQTGSMQRSWTRFQKAQEIVSTGKLGTITKVLVNVGDPARPYDLPAQTLPKEIDWNLWCGPAPLLTYHESIAPAIVKTYPDWRFFKETGGGILSDWGAHMFDIAQWCLGMDHTGPVQFLPPMNKNATRGLRMFYANGVEMVHEDFGRGWGVRFIGTEGTMDISRSYLETTPSTILDSVISGDKETLFKEENNHYQNWLTAMKTKSKPLCDVEIGHRSASVCNIANIAYELGRPLEWNPQKEKFDKDAEANALRKRKNRKF